jgi:hypothetical protein
MDSMEDEMNQGTGFLPASPAACTARIFGAIYFFKKGRGRGGSFLEASVLIHVH